MNKLLYSSFTSILGEIYFASTCKGICWLTIDVKKKISSIKSFLEKKYGREAIPAGDDNNYIKEQLNDYLKGSLKRFQCTIDFIEGTPFQKQVWQATSMIPFQVIVIPLFLNIDILFQCIQWIKFRCST